MSDMEGYRGRLANEIFLRVQNANVSTKEELVRVAQQTLDTLKAEIQEPSDK